MRERPKCDALSDTETGITPACAGKTNVIELPSSLFKDHPRMCGKDDVPMVDASIPLGSPPHVRERHAVSAAGIGYDGITPACAGKTERDNNRRTFN